MGFAPPPYDGFAFLASAHTRMRIPCYEHTIHRFAAPRNTSSKKYCACRRRSPVLDCATRCLSHARLVSKGQGIPNEFLAQLPRNPKRRSSQKTYSRHLCE